jgi:cation-transporting ATPase E
MLTALLSIIALFTYPITPTQITLINIFTIGTPGFLFALEADKNRITEHFIYSVIKNAVPAGLTNFLLVGALLITQRYVGFPEEQIPIAATFILCFVGIIMLIKTARPINLYRAVVIVLMVVGAILAALIFQNLLFGSVVLSLQTMCITLALAAASVPLMILFTFIIKLFEKLISKKYVDKI